MAATPDELLRRAVEAHAIDAEKGQAALTVYARLQQMGAQFEFGDFLVERGLLTQEAVDAFGADDAAHVTTVDTLGDFVLIELLGEGANGSVFRANQISLNRDVALKILNSESAADPAAVESFLSEARAVAKINHSNVVQGISAGSAHGLHYFAMELLEGGSARAAVEAAGGRLPERRALEIIRQSAAGLHAAHTAGMLHRDIKPDNILLARDGTAKLTDLGISQMTQMESGAFWGSPPYVAPEVITGQAENDPRSDIYSLGATLFELLVGAPPFLAAEPEEILRLHLSEEPLDIGMLRTDLHPRTVALVRLMLAKDPAQRARSADVVVAAIDRVLQELASVPPAVHASPLPPPIPARVARPVPPQRRPPTGGRPLPPRRPLPQQAARKPVIYHRPRMGSSPPPEPERMFDLRAPPPAKARPQARPGSNLRPQVRPRPKPR